MPVERRVNVQTSPIVRSLVPSAAEMASRSAWVSVVEVEMSLVMEIGIEEETVVSVSSMLTSKGEDADKEIYGVQRLGAEPGSAVLTKHRSRGTLGRRPLPGKAANVGCPSLATGSVPPKSCPVPMPSRSES